MENPKTSKLSLFATGLLIVSSLVILVLFVVRIDNEVAVSRESEKKLSQLEAYTAQLEAHVAYQNEYYNRLLTDEEFVRRLIKRKFEYTYPDEIVFKFKDGNIIEDDTRFIQ